MRTTWRTIDFFWNGWQEAVPINPLVLLTPNNKTINKRMPAFEIRSYLSRCEVGVRVYKGLKPFLWNTVGGATLCSSAFNECLFPRNRNMFWFNQSMPLHRRCSLDPRLNQWHIQPPLWLVMRRADTHSVGCVYIIGVMQARRWSNSQKNLQSSDDTDHNNQEK